MHFFTINMFSWAFVDFSLIPWPISTWLFQVFQTSGRCVRNTIILMLVTCYVNILSLPLPYRNKNDDAVAVTVAVSAFALIVGAFILLGVLSFAAFLAFGSSILFAGVLYVHSLSRTTMRRIRPTGTHVEWLLSYDINCWHGARNVMDILLFLNYSSQVFTHTDTVALAVNRIFVSLHGLVVDF